MSGRIKNPDKGKKWVCTVSASSHTLGNYLRPPLQSYLHRLAYPDSQMTETSVAMWPVTECSAQWPEPGQGQAVNQRDLQHRVWAVAVDVMSSLYLLAHLPNLPGPTLTFQSVHHLTCQQFLSSPALSQRFLFCQNYFHCLEPIT